MPRSHGSIARGDFKELVKTDHSHSARLSAEDEQPNGLFEIG
jgi:hypothetical protein